MRGAGDTEHDKHVHKRDSQRETVGSRAQRRPKSTGKKFIWYFPLQSEGSKWLIKPNGRALVE